MFVRPPAETQNELYVAGNLMAHPPTLPFDVFSGVLSAAVTENYLQLLYGHAFFQHVHILGSFLSFPFFFVLKQSNMNILHIYFLHTSVDVF